MAVIPGLGAPKLNQSLFTFRWKATKLLVQQGSRKKAKGSKGLPLYAQVWAGGNK